MKLKLKMKVNYLQQTLHTETFVHTLVHLNSLLDVDVIEGSANNSHGNVLLVELFSWFEPQGCFQDLD